MTGWLKSILEVKVALVLIIIGFKKSLKSAYPTPEIIDLMIKRETKFTLGDDSHGFNDVGLFYDQTFVYLKEKGIKSVYGLERRDNQDLHYVSFPIPETI